MASVYTGADGGDDWRPLKMNQGDEQLVEVR
jgi:hypothetical protein